jgi:hypothetical protein
MKRHFDSSYIAGLWGKNLPIELLWEPGNPQNIGAADSGTPSWSWFVIDGPVTFPGTAPKVEILEMSCVAENKTSVTDFPHCYIRLRGRLARALINRQDKTKGLFRSLVLCDKAVNYEIAYDDLRFEAICDFPGRLGDALIEIFTLQLTGVSKFYDMDTSFAMGLVLEKGRNKSEFARYGYFDISRNSIALSRMMRAFDDFDHSTFSQDLLSERRGNSKVYEIILV